MSRRRPCLPRSRAVPAGPKPLEAEQRRWSETFEQEKGRITTEWVREKEQHDYSVKDLAARNEALQQEMREAADKVRDIALKAIEGASGATALSRVSEIALQQAKGRET